MNKCSTHQNKLQSAKELQCNEQPLGLAHVIDQVAEEEVSKTTGPKIGAVSFVVGNQVDLTVKLKETHHIKSQKSQSEYHELIFALFAGLPAFLIFLHGGKIHMLVNLRRHLIGFRTESGMVFTAKSA
jgi:hypothetical protein